MKRYNFRVSLLSISLLLSGINISATPTNQPLEEGWTMVAPAQLTPTEKLIVADCKVKETKKAAYYAGLQSTVATALALPLGYTGAAIKALGFREAGIKIANLPGAKKKEQAYRDALVEQRKAVDEYAALSRFDGVKPIVPPQTPSFWQRVSSPVVGAWKIMNGWFGR